MSVAHADEPERYGWRQPRPLRYGLFPQRRPLHAAVFALLVGPLLGTIVYVAVGFIEPMSDLRHPGLAVTVASILLAGLAAYVVFSVPAAVAGFVYGAWWRRAPNTIAALAGAPLIGFVVSGLFMALLADGPTRGDVVVRTAIQFGAIGAAAATAAALWLEYLWRHPLDDSTPWQKRKGIVAGLVVLATILVAALWVTLAI